MHNSVQTPSHTKSNNYCWCLPWSWGWVVMRLYREEICMHCPLSMNGPKASSENEPWGFEICCEDTKSWPRVAKREQGRMQAWKTNSSSQQGLTQTYCRGLQCIILRCATPAQASLLSSRLLCPPVPQPPQPCRLGDRTLVFQGHNSPLLIFLSSGKNTSILPLNRPPHPIHHNSDSSSFKMYLKPIPISFALSPSSLSQQTELSQEFSWILLLPLPSMNPSGPAAVISLKYQSDWATLQGVEKELVELGTSYRFRTQVVLQELWGHVKNQLKVTLNTQMWDNLSIKL